MSNVNIKNFFEELAELVNKYPQLKHLSGDLTYGLSNDQYKFNLEVCPPNAGKVKVVTGTNVYYGKAWSHK